MNGFIATGLAMLIAMVMTACVSAGDKRADLRAIFHDQIAHCYALPKSAIGADATVIEVRLNLDGSLAQAPKVLQGIANSAQAKAALAAVKRCAPFHIPAGLVPRYVQWRVMVITFNTGMMSLSTGVFRGGGERPATQA
ncbi:hypothetical protein [Microvirga sp. VF16]|uniref:hypothetical protein n=1 Tax=Microvirga sp. VF16 TaxID=2807101 RepID=UPI00193D9DF0|nr:hypothetical protein [Microvirga sp. VF16]QRM27794.1 hypothetical protein JO965_16170 [Microvirga sp. VF16]